MSSEVSGIRDQVSGEGQRQPHGGARQSRAEQWEAALLRMFVPEQVEQMLEVMLLTYDTAVIRETEQSFMVLFNDKGLPRAFNGSNNVRPVKPKMYKAE